MGLTAFAAIRELHRRCLMNCLNQSFNLSLRYYSSGALTVFKTELMHSFNRGISENDVAMAIKACRGDPKVGASFHSFALSSGFIRYRSVVNSLMSTYCKAGKIDDALKLFRSMDEPDTVSYNTILLGFRNRDVSLCFAANMNANGVIFDPVTYTTALSFCVDDQGFLFGFQLHSSILKSGFGSEVFVGNSLITLYSRWGRIFEAEKVFYEMPTKDHVSWNAMLCGYSQEGSCGIETIQTFCNMVKQGVRIDNVSLTAGISACGHEKYLVAGKLLHALSIKIGYGRYVSVCNLLLSAYAKCEVNGDVKLVFQDMAERNVVSWTTMISVFPEEALSLFRGMRVDGIYPNEVTFIGLLHAITQRNMVKDGQMIHGFCLRSNFVSELHVSNSLISMYAKFESMGDAVKVFDELHCRDVISWNALISGYAQNRSYEEAFEAFRSAISDTRPNQYTFGSILSAIGSAEAISLRYGQRCHSHLFKSGLNSNPIVSAALLDMYGKRGSLAESKKIFKESVQKTQFAWTAIISAHARHGDYDSVMAIFYQMQQEGVRPDSITFLSLLTACGRKGMVDKGRQIWDMMVKDNLIVPLPEHYACMVDMLGRAGRLKEAEEFVRQIPGKPSFSALQSLLGACRTHGDTELGGKMANALIELQPEESGSYVLMSNLYAEKGDWDKVATLRRQMKDKRVRKEVGLSWVDVGNNDGSMIMHGFSSKDTSHPRSVEIYHLARCIGLESKFLEREGPNMSLVDIY
ncbi:pentatricopeptide repeat-containing protein At4g32430, mitochondrial-like [Silene latifolia]|uniref:pentatricopeptide repeat-containing protein At4g32430, mitochondrial-like n=1 Tax=Silene latifolia TaxID=37657 RepID=UPI003D77F4AF